MYFPIQRSIHCIILALPVPACLSACCLSLLYTLPSGLHLHRLCSPAGTCGTSTYFLSSLFFPRLLLLLCHLLCFPFLFPNPNSLFFLLSPIGVTDSLCILKFEALAEKVYLLNYLNFT